MAVSHALGVQGDERIWSPTDLAKAPVQQTLIIAVDDARLADGFDIAVKQPRERITVVSRDPREQVKAAGSRVGFVFSAAIFLVDIDTLGICLESRNF